MTPPRLDRFGIPIDPNDWDVEDWRILWLGIQAIKATIAERHKRKVESVVWEIDQSTDNKKP